MIDQRCLLDAFREFATRLLGSYEIGPVLYELTDQVVAVLGVDGVGVSLGDSDGVLRFVTATDADVAAIEEERVAHEQGPCQEAFRTGACVVVPDLAACGAWPDYRAIAMGRGAQAVAGGPMPVGVERVGALNLDSQAPYEPPEEELEVAQL